MNNIVRTPTQALGGITEAERVQLEAISKEWIDIAFRTDPIDPSKIVPAIENMYAAAGLDKPRVIIVPSPLVMAFASGAALAILDQATDQATWQAIRQATDQAIRQATDQATWQATDQATDQATWQATGQATDQAIRRAIHQATWQATDQATWQATDQAIRQAIRQATDQAIRQATDQATEVGQTDIFGNGAAQACFEISGNVGLEEARKWYVYYQGGNTWAAWESYIVGCRDVLGLKLPEYDSYKYWEQAARHGGFRVMHPTFCMVCDFPELIEVDDQNRPHSETGPSHRWRDGWSLYHWHGVSVPAHWIEDRENIDPNEVIAETNVERRAAGAAMVGWSKMASVLERRLIDGDPDTDVGALIELTLPGLPTPGRFLQAVCPRNGTIVEGVPYISDIDSLPINTAIAAQAWRDGLPTNEYQHPLLRT